MDRLALLAAAAVEHPRALRDETARLGAAHAHEAGQLRGEVGRLIRDFQAHLGERFDRLGEGQAAASTELRRELTDGQARTGAVVDGSTKRFGEAQRESLDGMAAQIQAVAADAAQARRALAEQLDGARRDGEAYQDKLREMLTGQLDGLRRENEAKLEQMRRDLAEGQARAGELVEVSTRRFGEAQRERLDGVAAELKAMREAAVADALQAREALAAQLDLIRGDGEVRQDKLRETLTTQLDQLRKENEAKLEQMRLTVDEKLHDTLEQRLGEKFKTVSEGLETVHKGLGEMQALASGVGDLKRVLTNVKSRGTWGEVQLGSLLEDMLTPEQYGRQVRVRPGSAETVDYAVHLPGSTDDGRVLLPLDCKFPHEDYERLLAAQDRGDPALAEAAAKALARAICIQAKSIKDKYVHPPHTTPFAVMYLPTEGLFAEVVRRPGLTAELSNVHGVTVTGPTTLAALLNSLKMGFQTLEIRKNAHTIMGVLGKAKKEFQDYGAALDAVDKKLDEAKNKVSEVTKRHKAVEKSLSSVEAPAVEVGTTGVLALAQAASAA